MKYKAEIFVFSDLYSSKKDILEDNSLVFIIGKLSNRQSDEDDVLKIIADDIIDLKRVRNKLSKHIHIKISGKFIPPKNKICYISIDKNYVFVFTYRK